MAVASGIFETLKHVAAGNATDYPYTPAPMDSLHGALATADAEDAIQSKSSN